MASDLYASLPSVLQDAFPTSTGLIPSDEFFCGRLGGPGHWYRLFVGWVPRYFTESDLKPFFDECGNVKDVIVLKDKATGQPKGCAFVSYATEAEAEKAIETLDRKIQLPGASSPMEVRFARSHQYIQAGSGPQDNRQLFFSRAPVSATEEDIRTAFTQYGAVAEVNIFTDRKSNISKGCGFVTMASRDEAIGAIEGLNDKYIMKGSMTSLSVKWADPDLQSKKKKAVEEANADNRMLFFAKILRTAKEDEVKAVFSQFGSVHDVNLFRPFQGAPTTKGCGLVTMGSHQEAEAAIERLDGRVTWKGMDTPMVVKWMDAQLQQRRREEHLAALQQAPPARGLPRPTNNAASRMRRMGGAGGMYGVPGSALVPQPHPVRRLDYSHDVPPLGCQPDAIKLFVGNIPKTYTADSLRPLFDRLGTVVELVVVRDKLTDESKGSAFVWYQTRAEAERAIAELHLQRVLHDPTGEQDRPLVVRRANPKVPQVLLQPSVVPQASPQIPAQQTVAPMMTPILDASLDLPAHLQGSFVSQPTMNNPVDSFAKNPLSTLTSELGGLSLSAAPSVGSGNSNNDVDALFGGLGKGRTAVAPFLDLGNQLGQGLGDPFGNNNPATSTASPNGSASSNFTASTGPTPNTISLPPVSNPVVSPNQPQGLDLGQMTLALHMTPQQVGSVAANLHTIQGGSGALVQLTPGANNSYVVFLSGNENQVDTAKAMVHELMSN